MTHLLLGALTDAGVQYFTVSTKGEDAETLRLLAEKFVPEVVQT